MLGWEFIYQRDLSSCGTKQQRLNLIEQVDQEEEWFTRQQLTKIFYDHAQLGMELPADFREAWYKVAIKYLVQEQEESCFDPQDFITIFYGHALLNQELSPEFIAPLFKVIRTTNSKKRLSAIYRGLSYFKLVDQLDQELQEKYEKFLSKIKLKRQKMSSSLQTSVQPYLRSILPDMEEEYWFDQLTAFVDFYSPKYHLVVEVDGPHHFIEDTKQYAPKTLLRDLILQQSNIQVVKIPYFHWEQLKDHQQKKAYLENMVQHMLE